MSRLTRAMSPAALFISILALVVATSATSAYAATKIGNKQLKSNAVTSSKIKNKTIAVADLANATVASLRGQAGPQGAPGANGKNGSARAYATVSASGGGTLVTARTSGFVSITRPGTGLYCLTPDPALGIDTSTVTAVVGVEWLSSSGNNLSAFWSTSGCGAGKITVQTYTFTAGNSNVASNSVGFTVVVP